MEPLKITGGMPNSVVPDGATACRQQGDVTVSLTVFDPDNADSDRFRPFSS